MASSNSYTTTIMQQIQACPWSPFNLHDVAKLEKCLAEISAYDSRFKILLAKLATETVFVEPNRKQKFLARDRETMRLEAATRIEVDKLLAKSMELEESIRVGKEKLDELAFKEENKTRQIAHLKRSISILESKCESQMDQFGLVLECTYKSFVNTSEIIGQKVPDFIQDISKHISPVLCQILEAQCRKFVIQMLKQATADSKTNNRTDSSDDAIEDAKEDSLMRKIRLAKKEWASKNLTRYLNLLSLLFKDIKLIDQVYCNSTEIAEEIEHLSLFNNHLEYLEKGPQVLPKRQVRIHHDLRPMGLLVDSGGWDCKKLAAPEHVEGII